jgi:hypothetical protein
MRAVEVVPLHPIVHCIPDLGPGRQVQLWQYLPEVILHHVVPLIGLAQRLRVGDRFKDMLDRPFLAE